MKRKLLCAIVTLLMCNLSNYALQAQEGTAPLSKAELISMLKPGGNRRISQAEIALQIDQRGIAFVVDSQSLNELRQAGARAFLLDAIERAGKNGGRPVPETSPANAEETRVQGQAEALAKLPLIEQARQHALDYARELPDFIVTQKVRRYVEAPGIKDWKLEDTLEVELSYHEGQGEQFKLLRIDGKPTRQSYEELGGSTSTGEFGSMLAALFVPQSKAEFKEVKKETYRGRATVVYDFSVKKANSLSTISDKSSGQKTIAGYKGSIWIDTETQRVLRIESSNEGMPPSFPITLSENAIEYDWITISGQRYLLPVSAEVLLGRDRDKVYTRNTIEFQNYHRFEGKIKIPTDQ